MYKDAEKRSLQLMKRGEKLGAPNWLMDYCRWAIDRAQFYRRAADDKDACSNIEGWRSNRFTKAMVTANHAGDVMDAFLRAHETPNARLTGPKRPLQEYANGTD